MSAQVIALADTETDTLHGIGSLGFHLYILLRTFADYGTGIVGRTRPVSLAMLATYTECHTTRGAGVQIEQPTEKAIRNALAKLQRAGLLRRLAGDRLAFSLPLALTASSRPFQTGQGEGTLSSTQPGSTKPAPALAMLSEPGTRWKASQQANRAHIMFHVNLKPHARKSRPVDKPVQPGVVDDFAGIGQWLAGQWFPEGRPDRAAPRQATAQAQRKGGLAEGVRTVPQDSADEQRLLSAGRQKGIEPRPGESWAAYRARVFDRPLATA